jgi:hypothetical protein
VARVAVALLCSAEQRAELMNLARSRTEEARLVERAKIVLAWLEGKRNDQVSRELGMRPNTVGLWRKRFAALGIAGLHDQPDILSLTYATRHWRLFDGIDLGQLPRDDMLVSQQAALRRNEKKTGRARSWSSPGRKSVPSIHSRSDI